MQANFENGVLTVTLPKPKEQQKQSQLISVQSKEGQQSAQVAGGNKQGAPAQGGSRAAAGD